MSIESKLDDAISSINEAKDKLHKMRNDPTHGNKIRRAIEDLDSAENDVDDALSEIKKAGKSPRR